MLCSSFSFVLFSCIHISLRTVNSGTRYHPLPASSHLVKVKVKVHALDIAPLRSESPLQKRSGMARVLNGFHSFTCTPTPSSAFGMSHICLCLPSRSWYSFTDPGGTEGWVDLCEVAHAEIRTCNLVLLKWQKLVHVCQS